jgi:hypothetical protein
VFLSDAPTGAPTKSPTTGAPTPAPEIPLSSQCRRRSYVCPSNVCRRRTYSYCPTGSVTECRRCHLTLTLTLIPTLTYHHPSPRRYSSCPAPTRAPSKAPTSPTHPNPCRRRPTPPPPSRTTANPKHRKAKHAVCALRGGYLYDIPLSDTNNPQPRLLGGMHQGVGAPRAAMSCSVTPRPSGPPLSGQLC